jgi:hypothetical protein
VCFATAQQAIAAGYRSWSFMANSLKKLLNHSTTLKTSKKRIERMNKPVENWIKLDRLGKKWG